MHKAIKDSLHIIIAASVVTSVTKNWGVKSRNAVWAAPLEEAPVAVADVAEGLPPPLAEGVVILSAQKN